MKYINYYDHIVFSLLILYFLKIMKTINLKCINEDFLSTQ